MFLYSVQNPILHGMMSRKGSVFPFIFGLISLMGTLQIQAQKALFTRMDPTHSGVTFTNTLKDTKDHNILIYSNFYGGGGVGIGDFNQDGLPDLYFAGNQVGDKLYLNKGDFVFEDRTKEAGILNRGSWSSGVVIADVNNDGWLDIYVTKELYDKEPELRRNELYINQGDGSFKEEAQAYGVDHDARTRHATFLDYDKDGWLDLYLLNQPPNPGNFSELYDIDKTQEIFASRLFRNTGKGSFVEVTREAGLFNVGFPNSVTASDVNNDGWTDLYVANDFDTPDWMFINQGNGTFVNVIDASHRHISYFSMGVDAADINNDGLQDIMVLDMQAEDNFRIKSNMSGMDRNSFWKVFEEGGHYQYMYNSVQLNQGASPFHRLLPQFSDIAQLTGMSSTDWSWSNLIADFDNDGWKDVFVTNGLLRDIRNTDSDKKFSLHVQEVAHEFVQKNPEAGEVSIWEILDLEESLKMIPSVPLNNYAFKNNGDLSFTKVIEDWGFDTPTFSNGAAYADLDLDGDLDLVINNINEVAYLYKNESQANNFLRVKLTDSQSHRSPFGVKVKLETSAGSQWYEFTNVRGMYSTSEHVAHFGIPEGATPLSVEITWWEGNSTLLSDIKANQVLEVDYASREKQMLPKPAKAPTLFHMLKAGIPFTHEENVFDDYDKQVLLPHKMSQFGPALCSGDVNQDGLEDLFIGGARGQAGQVFLQSPAGFQAFEVNSLSLDKEYEDVDAAFFDADGDGDLDLYIVSGGNSEAPGSEIYQDRLYINDGKGNFQRDSERIPAFFESGSCVRAQDIDKDGDVDLFVGGRHIPWAYPMPATSRILENKEGVFVDVTKQKCKSLQKLGMVTDAQWTDPNKDGLYDLVIVGEWMPISYFEQNSDHSFSEKTRKLGLEETRGWWYSLTEADIDGDGDPDFIAGNLGLNYKYKTSPEEPFEVHYNDFDQNGSKDIVLSYYNFGERFPLRGRSCSAEQVPTVGVKFPTYDLFADSDLETVYGEDQLTESLQYEAHTFASSFVERLEDGSFQLSPLPNEAQVSSINTVLAEDFDQDGLQDLLLAGNLFTSEVETPRNDAGVGLFMKGEGKNGFEVASPAESGILLPYDVKKMLSVTRADGSKLLVVACNDDRVRLLQVRAPIK